MIVVHHLENSRSQRILWLLEELGLDYEVRRYERDPKTSLAPPELLAVHPLGKSPVITDGEQTVAESGLIIDYLIDRHGQGALRPSPGSADHLRYRYWLHYAEGSLMPYLVMSLVFRRIETSPMPFFVRPIAKGIAASVDKSFLSPNLVRHLQYLEAELGTREWFVGDTLSGADIMLSFPLEAAQSRVGLQPDYPRLAAFLARIQARPAYRRALERGGPYSLLS